MSILKNLHKGDKDKMEEITAKAIAEKPGAKLELWDTTFKAHAKEV